MSDPYKELTPRRQKFVAAYLRTLNATKAAKEAGYSPETADQQGSRLLKNVKVRHAINLRLGRDLGGAIITRKRITQELADLATACMADVATLDNRGGVRFKPTAAWPARARKAVTKLKSRTTVLQDGSAVTETTIELADKRGALELLAKTHGMVVDRKLLGSDPKNPLPSPVQTYMLPDNGRGDRAAGVAPTDEGEHGQAGN